MRRGHILILFISCLILGSVIVSNSITASRDDIDNGFDVYSDDPSPQASGTVAGVKTVKTVNGVNILGIDFGASRKNIQVQGKNVFLAYNWNNGSNVQVSIIASYDSGETWTPPIDLWSGSTSSYSSVRLNTYIWKDKLYVFIDAIGSPTSLKHLYYKCASVSNWTEIKTANLVSIPVNYVIDCTIDSDDSYMYLVVKVTSLLQGYFLRYDGVKWSTPKSVVPSGHCGYIAISADNSGTTTKLMIFYNRAYQSGSLATGYTYMISSGDSGTSWSSPKVIMNDDNDYHDLAAVTWNGTTVIISNHYYIDDINMVITQDGGSTWSNEMTLVKSRGMPNYGSWKVSFSVSKSQSGYILLAYENSDNDIKMIHSKDWGSNWLAESEAYLIDSGPSINPFLSPYGEFASIIHYNSGTYDLKVLDLRFIDKFKPANLTANIGYLYVNLSWKPPSDEVFNNFTFNNYTVYRGETIKSISPYRVLGSVTWFNDTFDNYDAVSYYYGVISNFKIAGTSPMSNTIIAEPMIPPPVEEISIVSGDFSIDLSWSAIDKEVTDLYPVESYNIYRGLYPDSLNIFATIKTGTQFYDGDIDAVPSDYYYQISYNLSGKGEGLPSEIVSTRPYTTPSKPRDLTLSDSTSGVVLKWMPPLNDGGYLIIDYDVFFGNSPLIMDWISTADPSDRSTDLSNLTPGLTYFIHVAANNRLGRGEFSDMLSFKYKSAPSKPENFQLEGGDEEINIIWSTPALTWDLPILGYRLYRGADLDSMILHIELGPETLSFVDPVKNGIEYYYAVSCFNIQGEGPQASPESTSASGLPGEVNNFNILAGNASSHLRWDGVVDDGGTSITGYRLYRNVFEFDMIFFRVIPSGGNRYDDTGLRNGLTQYYWISAINKNGEGPVSGPVASMPGSRPSPVPSLICIGQLDSVLLKWDAPSDGGDDIIHYHIYQGTREYSLIHHYQLLAADLDMLSFTDVGLLRENEYFYAVSAENSWGESDLSRIIAVRPLGLPSPPINISAATSKDSLHVLWDPPFDDGGLPITTYSVYHRIEGDNEWLRNVAEGLSLSIAEFSQGDVVNIRISSNNELGEGVPSEILSMEVGSMQDAPFSFSVEPRDSSFITYWIFGPGYVELFDHITIYFEDENHGINKISGIDPDPGSYLVEGLENGRSYTVWLKAENDWGEGIGSIRINVVPVSLPGPVAEYWVEEVRDGGAIIMWNQPLDDGGSEIEMINIYRGESGDVLTLVESVSDREFFEDSDLNNGITYYYSLSAVNEIGQGPNSEILSITPIGLPGVPTDFTGSATSDTISMSFDPPTTDGGSEILGYVVFKGSDPQNLHAWRYLDSTTIDIMDKDVKSGRYYYRIAAYNSHGVGESVDIDVEVPSRCGLAIFFSISSFFVPIIIGIIIIAIISLSRRKSVSEYVPAEEMGVREEIASRSQLTYGDFEQPRLSPETSPQINPQSYRPQLPEAPTPVSMDTKPHDKQQYQRGSGSEMDYHLEMLRKNDSVQPMATPDLEDRQEVDPISDQSIGSPHMGIELELSHSGEQQPPIIVDEAIRDIEFSKPPDFEEDPPQSEEQIG